MGGHKGKREGRGDDKNIHQHTASPDGNLKAMRESQIKHAPHFYRSTRLFLSITFHFGASQITLPALPKPSEDLHLKIFIC